MRVLILHLAVKEVLTLTGIFDFMDRHGLIASLILLFVGGFVWILYGDIIMKIYIDNLQQGKPF
jgi:Zn-dependent protease